MLKKKKNSEAKNKINLSETENKDSEKQNSKSEISKR